MIMKAYSLDMRERVVGFIKRGGSVKDAVECFDICRASVYRYLKADKKGLLAPKKSWGTWKKLNPDKLALYVGKRSDLTLKELQEVFKVSHNAIWTCLKKMKITLKKTHKISRKK